MIGLFSLIAALIAFTAVFLCANSSARAFIKIWPSQANILLTFIPAALRSLAIILLVTYQNVPGLLKDTLSASLILGLSGVFSLSCYWGLPALSEFKLNKIRWNTNLAMLVTVFSVLLFTQHFVPEFQYSRWMIFTCLLLVALYIGYLKTQTGSPTSYARCLQMALSSKWPLPVWQHGLLLVFNIASIVAISTLLPMAEGFNEGYMDYQLFAALFMLSTFSSECYAGFKLAKEGKGQSAALVMTGAILTNALITFPLISIYCYFSNTDSVSLFSDMQMAMMTATMAIAYMLHQNQKPTWMECSVFSTLFATYLFSCI